MFFEYHPGQFFGLAAIASINFQRDHAVITFVNSSSLHLHGQQADRLLELVRNSQQLQPVTLFPLPKNNANQTPVARSQV